MRGARLLPDLSCRVRGMELLDETELPPEELRRALANVAKANVFLGGLRSLRRHVQPLAKGSAGISLLDVGVGNGQATSRLSRQLASAGIRLRWVGLDLHPEILEVARSGAGGSGGPRGLVRGDARALPFADRSFDLVATTLTLHHFEDAECARVLAEMARVSRMAVLVSDLERHPVNYLGARLLSLTWWRADRVTRHDAPLSVRRSFTAGELGDLARQLPFRTVRVRRHFPYRLVLEGHP